MWHYLPFMGGKGGGRLSWILETSAQNVGTLQGGWELSVSHNLFLPKLRWADGWITLNHHQQNYPIWMKKCTLFIIFSSSWTDLSKRRKEKGIYKGSVGSATSCPPGNFCQKGQVYLPIFFEDMCKTNEDFAQHANLRQVNFLSSLGCLDSV